MERKGRLLSERARSSSGKRGSREFFSFRQMRDFKALERILLPAWDLAQGRRRPGAPAHKFAHANDFSGLTSSLRYFCSSSSRTARVLRRAKDEDGGRRLPVVFRASTRPKNSESERNLSPSETKRFAGWVVSHWHHYMRRINDFPGLFVFRDLTAFSFRTSSAYALPGQTA